jgi:RNA recognition motif-containing protein
LCSTDTTGDIIEIKLPVDPQNQGKHRGFAFLTFTNPDDAADAIDNYDLNELPGYAGRGKFLKCSVANINKFAAADSGGDQKFDRPSKWIRWVKVVMADEQFGNPRNGYRSTRRRVDRKDRRMERRHHSHKVTIKGLCNVVSITATLDDFYVLGKCEDKRTMPSGLLRSCREKALATGGGR